MLAQRSREDRAALLDDLVAMLSEIVPGRAGRARAAAPARHLGPLAAWRIRLRPEAERERLVRSEPRSRKCAASSIRTDPMEIDAFLAELGLALDAELRRTERGRDALRGWLNSTSS